MVIAILCTVCALCTCVAAWCMYRAGVAASNAEHAEKRIVHSRGRLIALEQIVDKLDESQRKLWGRVSVMKRHDRRTDGERQLDVEEHIGAQPLTNGLDPDLEATLALQRAAPARPGA